MCSTCVLNKLTNFLTTTMKFRQPMARIDLFKKVTSPFTRIGILTNLRYQDEINEYPKLFISDLLNISIQLMTISIIFTILTIYMGIKMWQILKTEQIVISATRHDRTWVSKPNHISTLFRIYTDRTKVFEQR